MVVQHRGRLRYNSDSSVSFHLDKIKISLLLHAKYDKSSQKYREIRTKDKKITIDN